MNWSNGQLARHSRKRYNTDSTKQKQYFAQAKRRQVTETRRSGYDAASFVPSYLQDANTELNNESDNIVHSKEPKRRLLTLNEPSQSTLAVTDHAKNGSDIQKPKRITIDDTERDVSIEAKRRKLLQQSDWTGVELQKPVIIKYPEMSRSATRARQRAAPRPTISYSPGAMKSYNQIPRDAFIKIASQEYHYSPGNNSIRTRHSIAKPATPATPVLSQGRYYDRSSSASRSLGSFVTESPCLRRTLQAANGKEQQESQLQGIPSTSPSTLDEVSVNSITRAQILHQPQPTRKLLPSIYKLLSESVRDDHVALSSEPEITEQMRRTITGSVEIPGRGLSDSVVAETIMESISSKISESPIHVQSSNLPHRQSLFGPDGVPSPQKQSIRSTAATYNEESQMPICSIPSSITTPDIYKFANAKFPDNRPLVPPYIRPAPETGLAVEDENIMWKRFLFGHANSGVTESAEHCSSEMPPGKEACSRRRLSDEISAPERPPPTRMATWEENASPEPSTERRHQSSTPRPPSMAFSTKGPSFPSLISLSTGNRKPPPKALVSDDGAAPVYFREQRNGFDGQEYEEAMTAFFSTSEQAEPRPFAMVEGQHMTSKPESLFHPPSLFVGRLAAASNGGAVASAAVAVPSTANQMQQHCGARISSPTATISTETPAPVVPKRKRRRRRDAGRPDIRSLPNIRGDPIEYTP